MACGRAWVSPESSGADPSPRAVTVVRVRFDQARLRRAGQWGSGHLAIGPSGDGDIGPSHPGPRSRSFDCHAQAKPPVVQVDLWSRLKGTSTGRRACATESFSTGWPATNAESQPGVAAVQEWSRSLGSPSAAEGGCGPQILRQHRQEFHPNKCKERICRGPRGCGRGIRCESKVR